MQLDALRALKRDLLRRGINRLDSAPPGARLPPIALGITGRERDFRLAVRVIEMSPLVQERVDQIVEEARGEVEVRIVGRLFAQATAQAGESFGHVRGATGTLGAVVHDLDGGSPLLLSSNHVIARENDAKKGDEVLQPGRRDKGKSPADVVGSLLRFVELRRGSLNRVDAAVAQPARELVMDPREISGLGHLRGVRQIPVVTDVGVAKVGRTTGVRRGWASAFEIDDLELQYSRSLLTFSNQIEIVPQGRRKFSLAGDSGSLVVDDELRAVGLLFGGNNRDRSYANPIGEVLAALDCEIR